MPCHTRMKTIYLQGLLWLYLLGFGYMVLSVEPGFLDFDNLPDTNFSCVGKVIGGYYADLETNCQMFHVCTIGQLDEPMDIRFLCLNGTVFDQETRVCERIDEVDCSKSERFYSLNLELYGNTQPSLGDDNAETDPPIIIKASTTTTTSTTTQKPKTKTTRAPFFTTSAPTVTPVTKVISSHHFPISGSSDIRFNPEEINISLNPGSSPNIRSKTVAYQQQVFSDSNDNNKKVVVTTHTSYDNPTEKDFMRVVPHTQRPQVVSTPKAKLQSSATPTDINYGFTYHQTENTNQEYHTEEPHNNYQYHHSNLPLNFRHAQFRNQFKTTTYRTEHVTTRKHPYVYKEPTTFRTPYVSSAKTPSYHSYSRTEKPQRVQLPLPLLPTLPPLTFSSPAPFSLGHHIETKRYTNNHQPPPRIIISASASVSDNSGRRLNYSLGTIGVAPLLEEPPRSYDEYKEHDVNLDPFYHDVPKIKTNKRRKRQTKPPELNDQAAADVLKFLFDWYTNHQKSSTIQVPVDRETITEINEQLAPIVEAPSIDNKETNFKDSALFTSKSKFNIVGDVLSVTEGQQKHIEQTSLQNVEQTNTTHVTTSKSGTEDYVDDNYEAVAQRNAKENYRDSKKNTDKIEENNTVKKEETTPKEKEITTTNDPQTTTVEETTTMEPTTTTTEPTTTSRIMGILRSRAIAHQKRIRNENQRRYSKFLASIKPKIRSMNKGRVNTKKPTIADSEPTSTDKGEGIARNNSVVPTTPHVKSRKLRKTTTSTTTSTTTTTTSIPTTVDRDLGSTTTFNYPNEEEIGETTTFTLKRESTQHFQDVNDASDNEKSHSEESFSVIEAPQHELTTVKEDSQMIAEEIPTTKELSTTRNNIVVSDKANDEVRLDEETETYFEEPSTLAEDIHQNKEVLEETDTTTPPSESQLEEVENLDQVAIESSVLLENKHDQKEDVIEKQIDERKQGAAEENEESQTENLPEKETEKLQNSKRNEVEPNAALEAKTDHTEDLYSDYDDQELVTQGNFPSTKELYNSVEPETTTVKVELEVMEKVEQKSTTKPKVRGRVKYLTITSPKPEHFSKTDEPKIVNEETTTIEMRENNNQLSDLEDVLPKPRTFVDEKFEAELPPNSTFEITTTSTTPDSPPQYSGDIEEDNTENTAATDIELTNSSTETTISERKESFSNPEQTTYSTIEPQNFEFVSSTHNIAENTVPKLTTTSEPYQTITTEPSPPPSTTEFEISPTNLTPAETTTTETPSVPRGRSAQRRTRPPRTRTSLSYQKPNHRHRFSTEVTPRPSRRKPAVEDEIIDAITSQLTTTENLIREEIDSTSPRIPTSTIVDIDEVPATDAPLFKSANPTQAESAKESLHTTPLSMTYKLHIKKEKLRSFVFNCFGKTINQFYSDPRDCRLFHYCTSGYTKNQLLDMKFVCDLGTYFDEEKLICTKTKPERCL